MPPIAFLKKAYNTLPAIFRGLDAIELIEILRTIFDRFASQNNNQHPMKTSAEEKRREMEEGSGKR